MASGINSGIESGRVFDVETQMDVEIREEELPAKIERPKRSKRPKDRERKRAGREFAKILEHFEEGDQLEFEQVVKYLKNPRTMFLGILYDFNKSTDTRTRRSLNCSSLTRRFGEDSTSNIKCMKVNELVDIIGNSSYIISKNGINLYNYLQDQLQEQIRYAVGSQWSLLED
jgi:hypothetical protein